MLALYNLSVRGYALLIRLASLFHTKAKQWVEGRADWKAVYTARIAPKNSKRIWFHCASLGEFEQARPLIEKIKQASDSYELIITFSSPSGFEARKNYIYADHVFFLPIDTQSNAETFVTLVNPDLVVFVKYEFWHHYLHQLSIKKIPVYLVSGVFRPNQIFFKWYGEFFRNMLRSFTHIFLQNEGSATLLQSIGTENYTITGDTRIDRCLQLTTEPEKMPLITQFIADKFCIVAGSTWQEEEKMLVLLSQKFPQIKIIIAPHEIGRSGDIYKQFQNGIFWSELTKKPEQGTEKNILIVDTIGMLAQLYQYADIAIVGGGFSGQLHNILEPAAWGKPIFYGPKTDKFPEADELIKAGGGQKIKDANSLIEAVGQLIAHSDLKKQKGDAAKQYILNGAGATEKVYRKIFGA